MKIQSAQVLESFRRYLDPHVFLAFAKTAPRELRIAALVRTGLVEQLEEELKGINKNNHVIDMIRSNLE